MSVSSEAQPNQVLTQFVLVFPTGVVPPWFPPDYSTTGRIEEMEFRFGPIAPQVSDVEEFMNQKWTVTEVQTYVPVAPVAPATVKAFFIAICTPDGIKPDRSRQQSILSINASSLADSDSAEYGITDFPERVQFDWHPSSVQWFEPLNEHPDFQQVAICWHEESTLMAA